MTTWPSIQADSIALRERILPELVATLAERLLELVKR